jgi:hypothetical protein
VDERDREDGPLVPVRRDPTYVRPVLETVELEVADLGMRYVKLVRRPSDGTPILDVMFMKGLRLTVDISDGMETDEIERSLRSQLQEFRPASWSDMEDAMTAVVRVAKATLGGSDGKVVPYRFDSEKKAEREAELRYRWSESLFFVWLKKSGLIDRHPYELAVEALRSHYPDPPSSSPPE